MKVISTFLQPSSVVASVKAHLSDGDQTEHLVIAKPDRLEAYEILPDRLHLIHTLNVWGRITSLDVIRSNEGDAGCSLLVVTDHPDPQILVIRTNRDTSPDTPRLEVINSIKLFERNARPAEFFNGCLIDSRGRAGIICTYTGKLKILELDNGSVRADFDTSLRELNIISMCFLPTSNTRSTVVSILHRNHSQHLVVSSHELSLAKSELNPAPLSILPDFRVSDNTATHLIPIPPMNRRSSGWSHDGGLLVLGREKVSFYATVRKGPKRSAAASNQDPALRSAEAEMAWAFAEAKAWCSLDDVGTRFLIGDVCGRLVLVSLCAEKKALEYVNLGEISTPTTMTPLASQFLYIGSHFGDAQLVRILKNKSSTRASYIEVVDTFQNVAPCMDAVIIESGDKNHTIVTCSGGHGAGSLRVIRNGAVFTESARIGNMGAITKVWTLKEAFNTGFDTYILASSDFSSHLFRLPNHDDTHINCSESRAMTDLKVDSRTLAFGNILTRRQSSEGRSMYERGSSFIQVTPRAILLLNTKTGDSEDSWTAIEGQMIVAADISPSQISIALSGGKIMLFRITANRLQLQKEKVFRGTEGEEAEISALSISPYREGSNFSKEIVIGFWESNVILFATLPDLQETVRFTTYGLPRSILLQSFRDDRSKEHLELFIGLSSGMIITHSLHEKGNSFEIGDGKPVSLGETPVMLSRCTIRDQIAIFATGMRSALFFWEREALSHSFVLLKDVQSVCALDSSDEMCSLVLSSAEGLVIGSIADKEKKHIKSVPLGCDTPVKLAYHVNSNTLAVGCTRFSSNQEHAPTAVVGCLKILDAKDYSTLHEIPFDVSEEVTALDTLQCFGEAFFCVGTTFFSTCSDAQPEPNRGRISILSASPNESSVMHFAISHETNGAVNALAMYQDLIIAGINSSVVVLEPTHGRKREEAELRSVTKWDHNFVVLDVKIAGDLIVVCDALSSFSVLKLDDQRLITMVKSYCPLWPICMNTLDEGNVIGANLDNNLFSYRIAEHDQRIVLEQDGLFNMGETVNKFVSVNGNNSETGIGLQLKQLMFSASGRISLVIDADRDVSNQLIKLESNLSNVISGPGKKNHSSWRAPSNSRGPSDAQPASGFLDGDFIDCFLDLEASSELSRAVLNGRNEAENLLTPRELRSIVERLRIMY